jgi:hypothetical protein
MKAIRTLRTPSIFFIGAVLFLAGSSTQIAHARTFIIPHILEKDGYITSSNFTSDTTLQFTYNRSLNGSDKGSADVALYLYDEQTGGLMQGQTGPVCGPCTFALNNQNRKVTLSLDDLIKTNGGGFDAAIKLGFGVFVVSGSDPDAVNVQGFVVNSHTSAFDLSVFGFDPVGPISESTPTPQTRRTFVMPHVLETSGRAASTSNAYDTVLSATYAGGLTGVPAGAGASLSIFLYDQASGQPMIGGGGEVCNPCTFAMGLGGAAGQPRKRTIVIDDLITAAGGFGGATSKQGFAVVAVTGDDPAGVSLQGFVVNSHTGPFDTSVFVFEPQEVQADARASYVIPHILEKSGSIAAQSFTFDTTIFATYTGGLAGLPQGGGASLGLYLYDDSGAPLVGLSGTPVCDPCTFGLGTGAANPRKQSIRIDDLILTRGGGFDAAVKLGFGVLVVGGADPDAVNVQGFVVNSHTGPFDVSLFGYDPQPLGGTGFDPGTGLPNVPKRTFVMPHVLEKSGTISSATDTFDTEMYATYTGGLAGTTSSNGATVKLYLYDSNTGTPMMGTTGEVCNPCMFDLTTSTRKLSIRIDDLIVAKGGFGGSPTKEGFAVVVLDGDTPNVNLQGFVVNAHTGPFDLSVFGFEPQPLDASALAPMVIDITPAPGGLSISIPTVIGAHYSLEGGKLDGLDWKVERKFEGDGTLKLITVPASSTEAFFRVSGN